MSSVSPWALLAVAILLEVVGANALKASRGFSEPLAVLVFLLAYGPTYYLAGQVFKRLPIGIVYAIWAGAGTALTALTGVVLYGEALGPPQLLGIGAIIAGVVVLQLNTPVEPEPVTQSVAAEGSGQTNRAAGRSDSEFRLAPGRDAAPAIRVEEFGNRRR
jgi:small multidrug resistance pump